jgi:hypothetical protein
MQTVLSNSRSRNFEETRDKIWGSFNDPSELEAEVNAANSRSALISEFRALEEQVKSTELLTSVEAPVYLLDYEEAMKLECGDKVQVFPDQVRSQPDFVRKLTISRPRSTS